MGLAQEKNYLYITKLHYLILEFDNGPKSLFQENLQCRAIFSDCIPPKVQDTTTSTTNTFDLCLIMAYFSGANPATFPHHIQLKPGPEDIISGECYSS